MAAWQTAASALVALATLTARPQAARAVETIYRDVPAWTSPAQDTRGITLGDVDGDGDLDLIRACLNLPTTLTLNIGGVFASTPAWSGPVEPTRCVALGDVDGDGDLDLVRGNNSGGGATLYLNSGGVFESAPVWHGRDEQTRAITLADMDGDGDLDLISGNLNPGSTVYRNVDGRFEADPIWTGPVAASNGLAVGDVNGDGRLDVVLGNFNQPATLFLNSPTGFSSVPSWSGPAELTRAVALGDVDGDGDLDLVRGNLGAGSTLTLNNGASFESTPIWTGPVEQTYAIVLGDVDDDGKLDLIRGNTGAATLTLNAGGTFASAPEWTGPIEDSRSLAFGDVDGDGDLDLVRGNLDQASTLYLNVSSPLGAAPVWTGPPADTRAVAIGDVDGDGDLDLVRGNFGAGATLVRSVAGVLDGFASWTGPPENTVAVVLGDIDGDGDLDLVRGNYDQSATLYLNTGDTFEPSPAWTGPREGTYSIALGDVDGDGDLDLVRGNIEQRATLYLNEGGTFASTPAWTDGPLERTFSVALADVDGDGDLDLVRGNESQGATLYLNIGGVFEDTPAWTGPVESTKSVVLADVDGDGDLDLVRGNNNQGSTLYLNSGGSFATAPAWRGPTESTESVALGDLDGDGDLDLIRGNVDAPATVTLNQGSTFDALPTATIATDSSWSVVLADVDADGDLDAVAGNSALYSNRSPWIARDGGASRPLPNNAAHLRRVSATNTAPNRVTLAFEAEDAESDALSIRGEYQLSGTPQWQPMDLGAGSPSAGPFTTSPTGIAHTLDWDVTRIPFDRREVVVRLRAISPPRRAGDMAFVPAYLRNVGQVVPVRPSLAAAPALLTFPTVTLGDTVQVTLQISNTGNRDLIIESIAVPVPEIVIGAAPGLTIPPGQHQDVSVRLAPRSPLSASGPIRITANDPARPSLDIAIATDVRDLTFQTQLLAVAPELPLGQAATVVVTPGPQVRIEGGWVFYRPRGATTFADSSRLVRQGSNFIALIPSQGVTEAGLEFYVRVENSGVTRTDPAKAPADIIFYPVASPTTITAHAIPDARDAFPEERATPVVVTLLDGTQFVEGALYYRAGGTAAYDSVALEPREVAPGVVSPAATIPAEDVGPRGIEFWARARTLTNALTDPRDTASASPKTIRVTVDRLAEPATHSARRYRLVTVPLDLELPEGASLEALLSDQPEFGPPDVTRWRAFRYSASSGSYLEVGPASADPKLHPEPGRAFWLIASEPNAIDTAPVSGRSTPTVASYHVPLEPGWNQIGNPFLFQVAWSSVRAEGPSGVVAIEPPVAWDESLQRYTETDVATLAPFEGYWLWNPTSAAIDLVVPPVEAPPLTHAIAVEHPGATRAAVPEPARVESSSWQLRIDVATAEHRDTRNIAGIDARAAEGHDALDRTDPPASPGGGVSVYFLDPARDDATPRTVDLRPPIMRDGDPAAQGRRWVFDVVRSGDAMASRDARLSFAGLDLVPAEIELRLVDRALERVIDLRGASDYPFVATRRERVPHAGEARFELLAGTKGFVASGGLPVRPHTTRLLPGFPSPMSSTTTFRFELAERGSVRLDVFDVMGRHVRSLIRGDRAAGVHELSWAGQDDAGNSIAPGIYLVRMAASGHTEDRRVVKLR